MFIDGKIVLDMKQAGVSGFHGLLKLGKSDFARCAPKSPKTLLEAFDSILVGAQAIR